MNGRTFEEHKLEVLAFCETKLKRKSECVLDVEVCQVCCEG